MVLMVELPDGQALAVMAAVQAEDFPLPVSEIPEEAVRILTMVLQAVVQQAAAAEADPEAAAVAAVQANTGAVTAAPVTRK